MDVEWTSNACYCMWNGLPFEMDWTRNSHTFSGIKMMDWQTRTNQGFDLTLHGFCVKMVWTSFSHCKSSINFRNCQTRPLFQGFWENHISWNRPCYGMSTPTNNWAYRHLEKKRLLRGAKPFFFQVQKFCNFRSCKPSTNLPDTALGQP